MIRIAAIIFGALLPIAANAQTVRLGSYLHPKGDTERVFNHLYLAGVKDGLLVYDVTSIKKLYCQPKNLTLTVEQANDIVVRWAKKQTENIEEVSIAVALLAGLQEIFPCLPN